jgi:hypothetical protein
MSAPIVTSEFTVFGDQAVVDMDIYPDKILLKPNQFEITGHLRGILEDLTIKPNSRFHTPSHVTLSLDSCELSYEQAYQPINEHISLFDIYELIHAYYDAYLTKAEGQHLFLYPGIEAFAIDQHQNLVIRLINICPKDERGSDQALSVQAFMALLERAYPKVWKKILQKHKRIYHIPHLLELLEYRPFSVFSMLSFVWKLFAYSIIMSLVISCGVMLFGSNAQAMLVKNFYYQYVIAPINESILADMNEHKAKSQTSKSEVLLYQLALDPSVDGLATSRLLEQLADTLQNHPHIFGTDYQIGVHSSLFKKYAFNEDLSYYQRNWDQHCQTKKQACQEIILYLPACKDIKTALQLLTTLYSSEEVFEMKPTLIEIQSKIKLSKLLKK